MRELNLQTDVPTRAVASIKVWAVKDNPLPSIINILTTISVKHFLDNVASELCSLWSDSKSKLSTYEIGIYDDKRIPILLCHF